MSTETSMLLLLMVLIQEGAAIRPVVTFFPNYKKIFTTESITMTCDGGSTIGWGNYIWYKGRSTVHNRKSYTIQSAGISDGGSYQCQTSTGEISDPARLDVSNDWVILQTPLYVYEGDELNIRCHHYPGYSGRRTIFYKDNKVIRDWTYNAEYYIGHVDRTTAGTYRCGKEIGGLYIDEVFVSVEELFPIPIIKMTAHLVFTKDNLTANCETRLPPTRQDTQLQFAFYREGQIVQDFSINYIYKVYNVQLEHSGKYSCAVQTTNGRVSKRSAERLLQIEEPFSHPNITATNKLYEGDPMTLICDTTISPYINLKKVQFAFYRDGLEVQGFTSSNNYEVQSSHLEHSGKYSCEVVTTDGRVRKRSAERLLQIEVRFSQPNITATSELYEGDPMTLTCDTTISPHINPKEVQFAFYKDGLEVQGFMSFNTYEVQSANLEDSGNYTCDVKTSVSTTIRRSSGLYINIKGTNNSSVTIILSASLGLLLFIIIIFILLYICYRSSTYNQQPPTNNQPASDNEHSPEGEVNYAVFDMTSRPQSLMPKDNGSNVVYTEVNSKANGQVKDAQGTPDTSNNIYQNIGSYR